MAVRLSSQGIARKLYWRFTPTRTSRRGKRDIAAAGPGPEAGPVGCGAGAAPPRRSTSPDGGRACGRDRESQRPHRAGSVPAANGGSVAAGAA
jgi:hypothetical protein